MTRHFLLAAAFAMSPTAFAGDTVTQVAAGTPIGSDGMRVAVWTSTTAITPERVELQVSPHDGSPALDGDVAVLTRSVAERQVWQSHEVAFEGDANGALIPARVTLMDAQAQPLGVVEMNLAGGGITCGDDARFSSFGTVHGHLHLDEQGEIGTVSVVVDGASTPQVAAVRLELGGSTEGAAPTQRRHAASLSAVQQLWTADLALPGAGGNRYQVDGVVIDGQGEPYGVSFVADVVVDTRPPAVAAPCPYGRHLGERVASLH